MERMLVVEEVLDLLRISRPTLDRYVRQARRGECTFPLPTQLGTKRKRLWNLTDLESWAHCRSPPLVKNAAPITRKQQRQKEKSCQERQAAAHQALAERHGIIIAPKNVEDEL